MFYKHIHVNSIRTITHLSRFFWARLLPHRCKISVIGPLCWNIAISCVRASVIPSLIKLLRCIFPLINSFTRSRPSSCLFLTFCCDSSIVNVVFNFSWTYMKFYFILILHYTLNVYYYRNICFILIYIYLFFKICNIFHLCCKMIYFPTI